MPPDIQFVHRIEDLREIVGTRPVGRVAGMALLVPDPGAGTGVGDVEISPVVGAAVLVPAELPPVMPIAGKRRWRRGRHRIQSTRERSSPALALRAHAVAKISGRDASCVQRVEVLPSSVMWSGRRDIADRVGAIKRLASCIHLFCNRSVGLVRS